MSNTRASPFIRGPTNHNLFDLTKLQNVIVAQERFVIYLYKSGRGDFFNHLILVGTNVSHDREQTTIILSQRHNTHDTRSHVRARHVARLRHRVLAL